MKITYRFELRKDWKNKNGEHPIVLNIHQDSERRKLATGVKLWPELWDAENQQIIIPSDRRMDQLRKKYDHESVLKKDLHDYQSVLAVMLQKLNDIVTRHRLDNNPITLDILISEYNSDEDNPGGSNRKIKVNVYDFIDKYIEDHELSRAKGSIVVYKSLRKHLKNFEKTRKKKITFEEMDYDFMLAFKNHLLSWETTHPKTGTVTQLGNTSISKQLGTLKTFLGYAKRRGIKVNSGFRDFSVKKDKLEVIALTEQELNKILNLDLSKNARLRRVRDVFCFSCATGLRYSDLVQLKREHIKPNEIRLTIKKTREPMIIPLNKISADILKKYEWRADPLPIISNQKFNNYIKEIGQLAELNEDIEIIRYRGAEKISQVHKKYDLISAHTGRKTFVTLSLEKGIPAEAVMKITGHSDYKSFQRYVNVSEQRKKNEMERAWGRPD